MQNSNYKSLIDKVKDKNDIVSVISEYVNLNKKGSNYTGCCPFHNEKTPSFTVSPSKGIYKCFGCGESGDVITFVEKHEKITIHETVLKLANRAKIKTNDFIGERSSEEIEKARKQHQYEQSILIANQAANEIFQSQISEYHFEYFKSRGLERETVETFGIGYNPKNANIQSKLTEFSTEILTAASLLTSKGNRVFDFFYDERIMFPIHNKYGKVVSFAGRTLSNEVKPKYLNSRVTAVYDKSKTLYGFHLAKQSIANENLCYIVEGYTDVMMLHQLEITNSVAKCGTAFTDEQAKMISKICSKICFIPDSDIFTTKAKFKTLESEIAIALESGLNVGIAIIESGDVCEIGSEIEAIIEDVTDAIMFIANHYFTLDNSPFGQKTALEKVCELIAKTDTNVQSFYITEICDKYKLGKKEVKNIVSDFAPSSDTDSETQSDDSNDLTHIKVLDSFYELSLETTSGGAINEIYVPRKRSELQEEHGKEYVSRIQRFNGIKVVPDHQNFQYIITQFYKSKRTNNKNKFYKFINWYNPLPYEKKEFREDEITDKIGTTLKFLKHIFGEKHFVFGLDYFTIMYRFPLRKLPALGFVSRLKGTGKSTILDWTKEFYGANATMSSVDRITKNFNKMLEGKILVCMEETKDENGTIENALKDMITNEMAIIEGKGRDSFTVANFAKVMFASNYETNCLKILDNEDRFAIFRVPKIEKIDNKMKRKLIAEIPYFMHFLENRKIEHEDKTRLWFSLSDYETEALNAIKENSQSPTIVLIKELIRAIFLKTDEDLKEFKLSSKNLADYMNLYHNTKKYTMIWLTNILKNENIVSSKHATNFKYPSIKILFDDWIVEWKTEKARYFTFRIEDYLTSEEIDEIMQNEAVSEDLKAKADNLPNENMPF